MPVQWKTCESSWGWTLVPEVDQDEERKLTVIEDPWEIRGAFLRLKHTEDATVKFLTQVGVWKAIEDKHVTAANRKMELAGSFGHRIFFGRALPITLEELWAKQSYWQKLLSSGEDSLRKEFSPPPSGNAAPFEKVDFALKSSLLNTLSLHLEWQLQRRKQDDGRITSVVEPRGVVEPFTLWELLLATTHIDLLRRAKFQICQRPDCATPFTGRERQYCTQYCGHLESVRKNREEEKRKRAKR